MNTVAHTAYICVALEPRYVPTRIMTTWNRPTGGFMSNYFLSRFFSTRTRPANEHKTRASTRVLETIVRWRMIGDGERTSRRNTLLLSPRISLAFLQRVIFFLGSCGPDRIKLARKKQIKKRAVVKSSKGL